MFDYVFGNGILHHLDLDKAYLEIARVLKPGGKAYFMEPLLGHPLVQVFRWATPGRRTADEKPMDFAAIESARSAGLHPVCRTHYLAAVAALLAAPSVRHLQRLSEPPVEHSPQQVAAD